MYITFMQTYMQINTTDKHIIYGTLDKAKKKSSVLIIFVHGLTGSQNEHIFFNGAKFFTARGVDTFRFDLYTSAKGGRKLQNCGISTHTKDLTSVIERFQNSYKKMVVVGHSLGGPVIMHAILKHISGTLLWDSTVSNAERRREDFVFHHSLNAYIIKWGVASLMSKKMISEWKRFPSPKDAIKKITVPVKIICAGNWKYVTAGKEYFKHANKPKEFAVIKGAGHNFDERGAEEALFKKSYAFIKKFI